MKLKKLIALACTFVMTASMLAGCEGSKKSNEVLNIYNVGDYIDPELTKRFTEETGIEIVYETYDTNEGMYQKLKSGSSNYDLIFPSDYRGDKLIEEDMIFCSSLLKRRYSVKNFPAFLDSSKKVFT